MVKGVNCFLMEAILLSIQNVILVLRVATLVISLAQRSLFCFLELCIFIQFCILMVLNFDY
jgi:hypothetical protein